MKIAFIGGGQIAEAIAALAKTAGHDSSFGVRNPRGTVSTTFKRTSFQTAIEGADLVILAVPWLAVSEVLPPLAGALAGKIVVDTTNAVNADWSPFPTGDGSSAAEQIQALLPNSSVVKAFNTIFADVLRPDRLDRDGLKLTVFVASDDVDTVQVVMTFVSSIGLAPINAGPLRSARYLEAIAHLNLELAFGQGDGTNTAILYHRAQLL